MSQENVRYAEVRFAPLLSENENLSCGQVIEAVIRGMNRGKNEFGVDYGIITCAMRHHSYEENLRMIRTAREYLGNGVCAADLAGAEAIYPMSEFMELFGQAKKLGNAIYHSCRGVWKRAEHSGFRRGRSTSNWTWNRPCEVIQKSRK